MTFDEWEQRFSNEKACIKCLVELRWPDGFFCPKCGHEGSYVVTVRKLYECKKCHYQSSVTAGTVFHASKVPLTKWFWAIYWMSTGPKPMSAMRLSQLLGVSWRTAWTILQKLGAVMKEHDRLYRVTTVIELNEALLTPPAALPASAARTQSVIDHEEAGAQPLCPAG
jgi:transposase-like protein